MSALGLSFSLDPDLSTSIFQLKSGAACLAQDLLNRLSTERGSLFYDEDYGLDVRKFLNKRSLPGLAFRIAAEVSAELKKDPRVARVAVTTKETSTGFALSLQLTTLQGPFSLVLDVSPEIVKIAKAEVR